VRTENGDRGEGRSDHRSPDPAIPRSLGPASDFIGVALGALVAGAGAGGGTVTLTLVVLRARLEQLLPLIVFGGVVIAATVAWWLALPITDWWRRGLTAALAVFGGLILATLSAPADMIAGSLGMVVLGGLLLTVARVAGRYSVRSRSRGA
jgi:hypothetical protein